MYISLQFQKSQGEMVPNPKDPIHVILSTCRTLPSKGAAPLAFLPFKHLFGLYVQGEHALRTASLAFFDFYWRFYFECAVDCNRGGVGGCSGVEWTDLGTYFGIEVFAGWRLVGRVPDVHVLTETDINSY